MILKEAIVKILDAQESFEKVWTQDRGTHSAL